MNGWENRTELGCTWSGIVDAFYDTSHNPPNTATNWSDFGGAGACSTTPPEAEIDTTVVHDGNRSLRVAQRPGEINGTDFRVVKMFSSAQAEVTLIAYLRFADDYQWATGDHKNFIFLGANEAQTVYVNHRGQDGDPLHARWVLALNDIVYSDKTNFVTRSTWYRIRVHIKTGTHGAMEMWVRPDGGTEQRLNMTFDAGQTANLADMPIPAVYGFKIDTTYNNGSFVKSIWYRWFDTVAMYSGLAQ
jgi:hypothetical protein